MKSIKKQIIVVGMVVLLIFGGTSAFAQLELPRLSPKASVMQTVGITEIKIDYCRPGVKGRVIWGELVPYDKIWRTGANEATTISFSTDVMIEGNKLEKGKYSLFTIPTPESWTIVFNKNSELWGTMGYQESEDALRITVTPERGNFMERMAFYFDDLKENSGKVVLHWENLRIPFTVETPVHELVMESAKKAISWRTPYQAAQYALENNLDMDQAKKWLNVSLTTEKNYWNTALAARFQAHEGNYKKAVKTMEEALQLAEQMERPPFNLGEMKNLLAEWKKK